MIYLVLILKINFLVLGIKKTSLGNHFHHLVLPNIYLLDYLIHLRRRVQLDKLLKKNMVFWQRMGGLGFQVAQKEGGLGNYKKRKRALL